MRYIFAVASLLMLAWLPAGGQQNTLATRQPYTANSSVSHRDSLDAETLR
jgi:hypothetical protein